MIVQFNRNCIFVFYFCILFHYRIYVYYTIYNNSTKSRYVSVQWENYFVTLVVEFAVTKFGMC